MANLVDSVGYLLNICFPRLSSWHPALHQVAVQQNPVEANPICSSGVDSGLSKPVMASPLPPDVFRNVQVTPFWPLSYTWRRLREVFLASEKCIQRRESHSLSSEHFMPGHEGWNNFIHYIASLRRAEARERRSQAQQTKGLSYLWTSCYTRS